MTMMMMMMMMMIMIMTPHGLLDPVAPEGMIIWSNVRR